PTIVHRSPARLITVKARNVPRDYSAIERLRRTRPMCASPDAVRCFIAVAACLLPAVGTVVSAAESTAAAIDEIVVVAHKSQRARSEVAGNVTVVTADELRRDLATSLADAFRYEPGIDYESAGIRFGAEGLNVRGIGGNRVVLLVDGVPLGRQFAVGSFGNATRDFIDAGLVQRIEVLHGPASTLYGSDAIGGVVAVMTPEPADVAGDGGLGLRGVSAWNAADESLRGAGLAALEGDDFGLL